MVVEGRRQGGRKPHVVHPAMPLKVFVSSQATEELTCCWKLSTFPIIMAVYRGFLLALLETKTSSGWRMRSNSQTGKSELGAIRSTSGKRRISGKPWALQEVYQQRGNK